MSATASLDAAISDAELALDLFVRAPAAFGGIILRGDSPIRDKMVSDARAAIARRGPVIKIPSNVDADRLLGGLDLTATLSAGKGIMRSGLLNEAAGGVVILPMAERSAANVAAHIAQAMDEGDLAVILLDDGAEPDEMPPAILMERAAFHCDLSALRPCAAHDWPDAKAMSTVASLSNEQLHAIAVTALALGVNSVRPLIFANLAARAHAALHGRADVIDADIAAAGRLILSPRATQVPQMEPPPPEPEQDDTAPDNEPDNSEENRNIEDIDLDDIVLDAAAAAIPKHILDQIDLATRRGGKGTAGKSGQKQKSAQRGRPMSARPGTPGNGKRLALIDSLRTAAPWQKLRRQAARAGDNRKIHIRTSDLRVRHFEQRSETLTIFAVDASGSSALSRLAEAKGAVEMMLAQAYVKRSQVALIAFRQNAAEILLPPTRSLTRARRALAALPGGGGTPLAAGLLAAGQLAETATRAGQTPLIAVLTDGKGNVAMDGTANRTVAMEEAHQAARNLSMLGISSIVIDISPRPREEAAELAAALNGRYLPLPQAQSAAMVAAIESL
ncbi:magnesium chelatase subunit D [Sphingorhabdus sp.]|uniref:magnesium chelatase subunit D n=1 Tax=Sphingorhabdus sp. TaxID=1902408 RepID=UPI00391B53C6